MLVLLTQAPDLVLQLKKNLEEKLAVKKRRCDSLKSQMTYVTGQAIEVEEQLHTSRLKEWMDLAEVKSPDAQRRNLLGDLHALRSKMPGFQTRLVKDVEDVFFAFWRKLAAWLSVLSAALRRGIGLR